MSAQPKSTAVKPDITQLLRRHQEGDAQALPQLFPLVYEAMRNVARAQMRNERVNHTLQPTALVHEAFLRLAELKQIEWRDRAHFFAVAANSMRRILVDHARRQGAQKRGGDQIRVAFDEANAGAIVEPSQLLALDAALTELGKQSERLAKVVELRFFGGLTAEESATVLGCSAETVRKDWRKAKLWLYEALRKM